MVALLWRKDRHKPSGRNSLVRMPRTNKLAHQGACLLLLVLGTMVDSTRTMNSIECDVLEPQGASWFPQTPSHYSPSPLLARHGGC